MIASASALAIASALEAHPRIRSVSYPFLESHPQHDLAKRQMTSGGTVVTFEVDTDRAVHWLERGAQASC